MIPSLPGARRLGIAARLALVFGAAAAGAWPLSASTATGNLTVSATVAHNCTVTTTTLALGAYDPVGANAATPKDGTGAVTIACTRDAAPRIALALGNQPEGSQRRLAAGASTLDYQIYQDANRTIVWGTGTDEFDPGAAPSSAPRTFTAYGRIPAGRDVPAGSYSDTIITTVSF